MIFDVKYRPLVRSLLLFVQCTYIRLLVPKFKFFLLNYDGSVTVQERERLVWEDHINQLEKFYVEEMVDLFHRYESEIGSVSP